MHGQFILSLTPSQHNGYNITCFGYKDGTIDLSVTGGTPPYTYSWSHGPSTQDVGGLPAGYYSVTVYDANQAESRKEITLTEPADLRATLTAFEYGNGYNISLFGGYDGSIALEAEGGVPPYAYSWTDGPTTQNRTQLGSDAYRVRITDANACELLTEELVLRQPDRSDWTMNGNAGTNPATQYIGTSDNKDLVFKSNGVERLRLLSTGDLKLSGTLSTTGLLYRDANGLIRAGGPGGLLYPVIGPCAALQGWPYWSPQGNDFSLLCANEHPLLGTLSPTPLRIITDGNIRILVTTEGKVGIGATPPAGAISGYRLFVEDGIATRDVLVKSGTWPDYVFEDSYHLLSFDELRTYIDTNKHLPGVPSAAEVKSQDGVEVGDIQRRLLKLVEEQALYILQLEERLRVVEARTSNTNK